MPEAPAARFQRIVVGALGVVLTPDNRVAFVLQQRGPFAGHWLLPGGGIEYGETAEQSVAREVREETGLSIEPPEFVAAYQVMGDWAEGSYHLFMLAFRARTRQTALDAGAVPVNAGVDGVRLAYPGELPLHPTDLRILTDAGVASFSEDEIDAALARDGIRMAAYPRVPRSTGSGESRRVHAGGKVRRPCLDGAQ